MMRGGWYKSTSTFQKSCAFMELDMVLWIAAIDSTVISLTSCIREASQKVILKALFTAKQGTREMFGLKLPVRQ